MSIPTQNKVGIWVYKWGVNMNMNEKFLTGLKTLSTEQQTLVFAFIKGLEAQKEIDKSA